MRNTSHLALSTTSLVALLSAFGCSSDGGGGDDGNVNGFTPGGGGTTGVAGSTGVPGAGGTTGGPVGAAGTSGEGQAGASTNAGLGGSATAAGGAGGAPVAMPPGAPPGGFCRSGAWSGYAFTATNIAGTTIAPATFEMLPAGEPFCVSGSVAADPDFA